MKFLLSILVITLIHTFAIAQKPSVRFEALFLIDPKPKVIGVPLPDYPPDAGGLGGEVSVTVVIDENGNVLVEQTTGPRPVCPGVTDPKVLSLRRVATEAALKAKFKPAVVDGQPVLSRGWLKYDFQLPVKRSKDANEKLERFTVVGERPAGELGGGVLNGKALSLPKPPYPAAARAVRASGPVNIQVLIDEEGNIFSAEAISGHPLLRAAAAGAACGAKFTPTTLSGHPVKVSGIIVYNFVP